MNLADSPMQSLLVMGRLTLGRVARLWKIALSLAIGLVIWEIVGHNTTRLVFAPFSDTFVAFLDGMSSGELVRHTAVSLTELAIGFVIGSSIGLAGGVLAALNKSFRDITDPWVSILYSTPYVAVIPIFIIWFGLGMSSKVALVVLAVFIPVWLNTWLGVTGTDPHLVEVMRTFGATRRQILKWVVLPWALPSFMMGIRLAFSRGFIAVIVGEFLGSSAGVGYFILRASEFFKTADLLAGMLVLSIIAVLTVEFLKWIQHRMVPWWEVR